LGSACNSSIASAKLTIGAMELRQAANAARTAWLILRFDACRRYLGGPGCMANGHARAVPEIAAAAMAIWPQAGGAAMGAVRICCEPKSLRIAKQSRQRPNKTDASLGSNILCAACRP